MMRLGYIIYITLLLLLPSGEGINSIARANPGVKQIKAERNTLAFPKKKDRTVFITDVIRGREGIMVGDRILDLSEKSDAPIYILINSPGGSVTVGFTIIGAIERAKERGVQFRCAVTGFAASMAFQILTHCQKRYALPYSMLLWHPVRVVFGGGMFSAPVVLLPVEVEALSEDLKGIENIMIPQLTSTLRIPRRQFYLHYHGETLHQALSIERMAPHFLTIVEDYENVPTKVFGSEKTLAQFDELDYNRTGDEGWRFDYTYRGGKFKWANE